MSNQSKITYTNNLLSQFDCSWEMLKDALISVPEKLLLKEKNDWCLIKMIYHCIETVEFYSKDTPEGMQWGKKVGIDYNKDTEAQIKKKWEEFTKDSLLQYLEEVKHQFESKVKLMDDGNLLQQDDFTKYGFKCIFEKYLYVLRHSMLHIGEIGKTMRDMSDKRLKWK